MIRKFKNGKLKLSVPKNHIYYRNADGTVNEEYYHCAMFWDNLYIESIEGNYYIVDFSTHRVYDYYNSYLIHNPLQSLLDDLTNNKVVYMYPLSKRESKALLELYYKEQEELG